MAEPRELSAYVMRKTERMLKEQLSCLGCHRFGNEGGRVAPDLLQVKHRFDADQLQRLIADPDTVLPGTMMPEPRLTPAKISIIVAYLLQHEHPRQTDVPLEVARSRKPPPKEAATAADLFRHFCTACHGEKGRGDGFNASNLAPPPTNLADPRRMSRRPDDTLFDIIAAGGRVFSLSPRMPAWGQTLDAAEIRSLVAYIRELCNCRGPAWSRDGG